MAKKTKIPEGITSKKTATGINVTISTNGRVLATMRGYNNNQNMQKGLAALWAVLNKAAGNMVFTSSMEGFAVTDLTPKKKAKKK